MPGKLIQNHHLIKVSNPWIILQKNLHTSEKLIRNHHLITFTALPSRNESKYSYSNISYHTSCYSINYPLRISFLPKNFQPTDDSTTWKTPLESSPCKTYQTTSYFTALTSTTKKGFQTKNGEYCKIIQWIFLLKLQNNNSFNQSTNKENHKFIQ